jgi:DNA repair protein RadC
MPSQADIEMIRQIASAAKTFNITVDDHIIVAATGMRA